MKLMSVTYSNFLFESRLFLDVECNVDVISSLYAGYLLINVVTVLNISKNISLCMLKDVHNNKWKKGVESLRNTIICMCLFVYVQNWCNFGTAMLHVATYSWC